MVENLSIRRLILAAEGWDGDGRVARPAALLVEGGAIVASGTPASIGRPEGVPVEDATRAVLLPGLVNAHAHLDLSHLAPEPYGGDFPAWLAGVRARRHPDDDAVRRTVLHGAALARAGGCAAVGDIAGAGSLAAVAALRDARLAGTSFLEVFGAGPRAAAAIAQLERAVDALAPRAGPHRLGLQPHAPYSCAPEVHRAAARLALAHDLPLATHCAETEDEIAFVATGRGALAVQLRAFGAWDDRMAPFGGHPVDLVLDAAGAARPLLVHLNRIDVAHAERIAATGARAAICPRATAYFGRTDDDGLTPGWRALRAAGVPLALGTDGLPCLDTADRISVLDEMRRLHRTAGWPPDELVRMATTHGAIAIGLDPALVRLRPGGRAGVLASDGADTLAAAIASGAPPRWLVRPAWEAEA